MDISLVAVILASGVAFAASGIVAFKIKKSGRAKLSSVENAIVGFGAFFFFMMILIPMFMQERWWSRYSDFIMWPYAVLFFFFTIVFTVYIRRSLLSNRGGTTKKGKQRR